MQNLIIGSYNNVFNSYSKSFLNNNDDKNNDENENDSNVYINILDTNNKNLNADFIKCLIDNRIIDFFVNSEQKMVMKHYKTVYGISAKLISKFYFTSDMINKFYNDDKYNYKIKFLSHDEIIVEQYNAEALIKYNSLGNKCDEFQIGKGLYKNFKVVLQFLDKNIYDYVLLTISLAPEINDKNLDYVFCFCILVEKTVVNSIGKT
jgi:hypothetical protein